MYTITGPVLALRTSLLQDSIRNNLAKPNNNNKKAKTLYPKGRGEITWP